MKTDSGIYILLFELPPGTYKTGALGELHLEGIYAYTGTAQRNLHSRIKRHLSKDKKLHWHIDYIISKAKWIKVYIKEKAKKQKECETAKKLSKKFKGIKNFGSSDCKCTSHLFSIDNEELFGNIVGKGWTLINEDQSNP